jgi:hypothetical protein
MDKIYLSEICKDNRKFLVWNSFCDLEKIDQWQITLNNNKVEFDLSNLSFISASGVIWILDLIRYRQSLGFDTYIKLPNNNQRVIDYLRSIRFDILTNIFDIPIINLNILSSDITYYKNHSYSSSKVKGIKYISFQNRDQIWQDLYMIISNYLVLRINKGIPDENAFLLSQYCIALFQFVENIVEHAGKNDIPGEGFFSFEPPKRNYPFFTFAFSDYGDGLVKHFRQLLESLKNNQHDEIIKKLCAESVFDTSSSDSTISSALIFRHHYVSKHKIGFYPILKTIHKFRGKLIIRTNDIKYEINLSNNDNQKKFKVSYLENFKPTIGWINGIREGWKRYSIPGCHINIVFQIINEQESCEMDEKDYYAI